MTNHIAGVDEKAHYDDIAPPPGAAGITAWSDLEHPGEGFRIFTGPRRAITQHVGGKMVGTHYVESHGLQEVDGAVCEVCVRAQVDIWGLNIYHHWDDMLTPDAARQKAAELRGAARMLTQLADAFEQSAAEVDGWVAQ